MHEKAHPIGCAESRVFLFLKKTQKICILNINHVTIYIQNTPSYCDYH